VVENALGGGVRLARDEVEAFWNEDLSSSTSNYLQVAGNFDYPMYLLSFNDATWLEDPYRQRLITVRSYCWENISGSLSSRNQNLKNRLLMTWIRLGVVIHNP
jgi:hypothetical protein